MANKTAIGFVIGGVLLTATATAIYYATKPAEAAPGKPPLFITGDFISIGPDVYSVRGVDIANRQYLLGNGTLNWVSSDYIDRVATYVSHVVLNYE